MGETAAGRDGPGWLGLGWVGSGVIGGAAAGVSLGAALGVLLSATSDRSPDDAARALASSRFDVPVQGGLQPGGANLPDAAYDLIVLLAAGNPQNDSDVEGGRTVRLGKLKGTSGDQQYEIPADVDPREFTHAYVWCRAFSVGFTRAKLA